MANSSSSSGGGGSGLIDLLWLFMPLIVMRFVIPGALRLLARGRPKAATVDDRVTQLYPEQAAPAGKRSYSWADYFILAVTVALVLQQSQQLLSRPKNIYARLGVPLDQPTSLLKKTFEQLQKTDPSFTHDALFTHYQEVVALFATDFGRDLYDVHGPEILDCFFCKQDMDYLVFTLSKLFLTICSAVLVIGLATSSKRTTHLRVYLVTAAIAWGAFEGFATAIQWDFLPEGLEFLGTFTLAEKIAAARTLVLAVLVFLPYQFARPTSLTDKDLLLLITAETARMLKQLSPPATGPTAAASTSNTARTPSPPTDAQIE